MVKKFELTNAMRSKDLKEAALAYADAGIPVFPLAKKGKKPVYKGGFLKATTDPQQIRKWWNSNPKANIGSPLVAGMIVLDFDGKEGLATYKKLELKEQTMKVKTARGFHLYFWADLVSKNAVMDGLDLKGGGEGGYIIMPPSIHPTGAQYKWNMHKHLENLPQRISLQLNKKDKAQTEKNVENKPLLIREGGRHKHMVSLAGYFVCKGYSEKQIFQILTAANEVSFINPLPDDEVRRIAHGCSKYKNIDDVQILRLSDQEENEPKFLIKPYICAGESNFLEGDPGCGKSTLLGEIAACVTTGKEFCGIKPDRTGNVLFFAIEDSPTSVFKTRARLQGADQSKIYYVDGYLSLDDSGFVYLENALASEKFELVIIDTFTSVVGDKNMNDNAQMAKMVRMITNIARPYNTAVILVRHLRKTETTNASYAGSGAAALLGGVRSALLMKRCPKNRDERYIAQVKCNGVREGKTLKFKITDAPNTEIGQLVWQGESDMIAEDLLMLQPQKESELDRAESFLKTFLEKGSMKSKILEAEANELGISSKTLNRAKDKLRITSKKIGKHWVWALP